MVLIDSDLIRYMQKNLPNIVHFLTDPPKKFEYSVGFIVKDDLGLEASQLIDTIVHSERGDIIAGIKTLPKSPWFKFVWSNIEDADVLVDTTYEHITDVYNHVFNQLIDYFPCDLVRDEKKKEHVIIFENYHSYFIVDRNTGKGRIVEKRNWYTKKRIAKSDFDKSICRRYVRETKFQVDENTSLTVEQVTFSNYAIEWYKLFKIYLNSENTEKK